jgi:hypothetical protein
VKADEANSNVFLVREEIASEDAIAVLALADRYNEFANRFKAAGNPDKAKELRDKATRFREGVSRLRKVSFRSPVQ